MKTKPLVIAVVLFVVAAAQSQFVQAAGRVSSYVNVRFQYAIDYPTDFLVAEREADNSDGRSFHARRGTGKMSVWGSHRVEDTEATPIAIAREYEDDCAPNKITYEVLKPRLVTFSCVSRAGLVIYQKSLVDKDVLRSVRFEYPYADRKTWNSVVMQISASFHPTF